LGNKRDTNITQIRHLDGFCQRYDIRIWGRRVQIEIINDSDKTFIGRIEKGFDFPRYHFSPEGLSMAEKTIEKFLARAVRLYEQEREEPFGSPLLGLYVRR